MSSDNKKGDTKKWTRAGASRAGADSSADDVSAFLEPPDADAIITELTNVKVQLRAAEASLDHCAHNSRELAKRAHRAERCRLAQMLHDGLQQLLVAAKMRLHMAIASLPPGEGRTAAAQTLELLCQAIDASRSLTLDLSPLHLVDEGLGAALIWLSNWFATHHGLKVTVEVATEAEPESELLRAAVFQGVREILFNAVKHAGTDKAKVKMLRADKDVQIVVEDEGVGFEPEWFQSKSDGFGLFSVKRRIEQLGGAMDVVSAPGAGTRVTLKAPVAARSPDLAMSAQG